MQDRNLDIVEMGFLFLAIFPLEYAILFIILIYWSVIVKCDIGSYLHVIGTVL